MRSAITLFSLFILLMSCGTDKVNYDDAGSMDSDEIVGGQEVTPGSRPYQISLQDWAGHFCGGALLTSEWVLTAAHCTSSSSGLSIRVGVHRLSSNEGQTISVSQVIRHPSYSSSTMVNDIALLRLASPADSSYTPLQLPTSAVVSAVGYPGDMVWVSGWGTTRESGSISDTLQEVSVPVVSNATCNSPQSYDGDIYDSMLCAGYASGGKDSCQGDSGGPLVTDYQGNTYSLGVVSWGDGCARPNKYGVYTRTLSFVDWIQSSIGGGGGGGSTDPSELDNGVPQAGLSASQGAWLKYYIDVPTGASNLVIETSGGSGDADLYVRMGAEPTTSTYNCRPYKSGNNETCSAPTPSAGRYYVFLRAYSSFSGVTLEASYDSGGGGGGGDPYIADGQTISNLSASWGNWIYYRVQVPAGTSSLQVRISGGSGDADLYIRAGVRPTTASYSCRPYKYGNNETCTISNPTAGDYYLGIRAYSAFSGVSLTATY